MKWQDVGENCKLKTSVIVLIAKYYCDDKIKNIEMGWACGAQGKIKMHTKCWLGNPKRREYSEEYMDWIHQTQDMNTVLNVLFP
jgi:hypothetical protein